MERINPLTGLYYNHIFFEEAERFLKTVQPDGYCMMAVDIEHFRLYNQIHGREEGNQLLKEIAELLIDFQKTNGGVVGYMGGDNFGILTAYDTAMLKNLRHVIREKIRTRSNTVGYLPAYGIYPVTDITLPAATMYDRATVALSYVIGNYTNRSCEYYPDMDGKIEEEIRLLSDIQVGIENDEFTFYIQPQCDITKSKIVGGESLVRWNHREKGLVPPGVFIPVLEKNGFIADLDQIVWDKVCQWIRNCMDSGYDPVPISINVSRIDIFSVDVPSYLESLLEKYNLSPELLKVEVTESAYAENENKVTDTVKRLRDSGFVVMMDDFGSGYSSLNMLKSVPVDVLKMDMRFLEINERNEEKGIGILESVVNMARQMRIPIVVEGVETKTQEKLLIEMGCRYAQGYYYYKPMSREAFEELLADERNLDHEGFWYRPTESIHLREFMDTNLFSDTVVNNILGAAAFCDMYENNIEITRVNEQYLKLMGLEALEEEEHRKRFWASVRDDDRQLLFSIFAQAHEDITGGASGFVHYLRRDGVSLWINIKVHFLREKEGHKLFYASLEDMTSLENKKADIMSLEGDVIDITEKQLSRVEKHYGSLPCGYGIGKLVIDDAGKPKDYEIIYANKELSRISGADANRLRYMMLKLFSDHTGELLDKAYRAAYLGETVEIHAYSHISGRYLDMTMYQYQYGYVGCIVQDVTHSHIYEDTLNNIMSSFREAYFLHIQDNYCRMIYPDDNHLLDRGNYEEVVDRHFATGKIMPYDEANVRKFLSLDNLKTVLAKQDSVEYKYKRQIGPGSDEWCLTTITVSDRLNGVPKTATITIRSIEALVREQAEHRNQNMAEMLATLSDGFFIYTATGDEKILYANPPVIKMFGCKNVEEFRELVSNSFRGLVHPDDLNRVEWEIHEQVKHSERNMDFIRYRIIRKDGEVRWLDDCGHLETSNTEDDNNLFYVFVSDITDTMSEAQKNKLIAQSKHINEN